MASLFYLGEEKDEGPGVGFYTGSDMSGLGRGSRALPLGFLVVSCSLAVWPV